MEEKILFPSYVFLVNNQIDKMYEKLRNVIGMTKLLGIGKEIIPLMEEEVDLLQRIGMGEEPLVLSKGVIENGMVRVIKGPLIRFEGCVKK